MVKRKDYEDEEPEKKPMIRKKRVAEPEEEEMPAKPARGGRKGGNDGGAGANRGRAAAGAAAGGGAQRASKWNDMDRHEFLQYLMKIGVTTETQALQYFKRMIPGTSDADFRAFVGDLCQSITHLNYTVRRQKTPCDDQVYVALVNRVMDHPTKAATRLKPEHLNYTKVLIERIAASPTESIFATTALNLGHEAAAAALKQNANVDTKKLKLKAEEAQTVLDQLTEDGFLRIPEAHKYALGPRTFLELGSFLDGIEDMNPNLRAKIDALQA